MFERLQTSLVMNGQGTDGFSRALMLQGGGRSADMLIHYGGDMGCLRPWKAPSGLTKITLNTNKVDRKGNPIYKAYAVNAPATLPKEAWVYLDRRIMQVYRNRLRAWNALRAANPFDVPGGMGVMVIQHQTMTDFGRATISMDPIRRSERDRPTFDTANFPLPVTHCDFNFTLREILASGQGGPSGGPVARLDTVGATRAGRVVGEGVEGLTIGTSSSFSYGGGTVYGYINYPNRLTYSLTLPTAAGWTPGDTINDLLAMAQLLQDHFQFGPFFLYYSVGWTKYLGADYVGTYPLTLRNRIRELDFISGMQMLDNLTGLQLVLISLTDGQTAEGVQFLAPQLVQWEEEGGMDRHFKFMAGQVPRLRADSNGNTGICHGS